MSSHYLRLLFLVLLSCFTCEVLTLAQASENQKSERETEKNNNTKLEVALKQPVTLSFKELPLHDCLSYIKDYAEVRISIDEISIQKVGLNTKLPITLSVTDVKLESALDRMLHPLDLEWVMMNEVLFITTKQRAETLPVTRTYLIADLQWDGGTAALANTLIKTVDPPSWSIRGGNGSIRILQDKLVINQIQKNHRAIGKILDQLRR